MVDPRVVTATPETAETFMPQADRAAARGVRAALEAARYTEENVIELLGDDAYGSGRERVPVHERRLDDSPLGIATRLCFLALPVPRRAFRAASSLVALGLAEEDGDMLVPRGRILPVEDFLVASDSYSLGENDPPGYVATYTPTAQQCACLTPRRRVRRAIDIGTGNGIQALLAARHAEHVIATDVNPRAVAFAGLNAALNGLRNVETRLGSLFEPVAGEQFDLITCNAPFVVSPESRFVYRDGGFGADELSERVVRGTIEHLAPGGYATLLVSWVAEDEDDPDVRPRAWWDGSDCDAWLLGLSGGDPLDHAAGWNDYLEHDPERYGARIDEWVSYFESIGVAWISEGALLLHRRGGDGHTLRADPVEDEVDPAGEQIMRAFRARAAVASGQPVTFELVEDVEFEDDGDDVRVRLDEGTHPVLTVSPDEATAIEQLDLESRPALRRELYELGFLECATGS